MKIQQGFSLVRIWRYVGLASLLFLVTWQWTIQIDRSLGVSAFASGWVLFGVLAFLSLFSIRKRLPFMPLAPSAIWFMLHTIGGFLALFLFWLHTDALGSKGFYGQVLTVLFYITSISGVIGLFMEKVIPRQLTCSGVEIIYERIPAEIAGIREEVESLILKCTEEIGTSTLAEHYLETLSWYFQKPRFFLNNVFGGHLSQHWVRQQCMILERFLSEKEREYLDKVYMLAEKKRKIDFHYALQSLLKTWLLVHIPMAAAVTAMVIWHLILIMVFFV
ncbi:MAG: hypothetical protein HOI80_00740 [Alphaproteobacteria bacterium]|jgi:hypothetical protein|nr:hypothetical protein [Nitrospina sp.]MBT5633116.1 hypothetical protein [Nitrospina sp.]MBT5654013.1 hypothetical protein [Alphaproteobacteria bacterium]